MYIAHLVKRLVRAPYQPPLEAADVWSLFGITMAFGIMFGAGMCIWLCQR